MIGFENFKLQDGIPIYMQILTYIKRGIIAGTVADGDELPSRRVLSALLGVNPNTIQKAYRMLEEDGLISSHSGAKSCMVLSEETVRRVSEDVLESDARSIAAAMKQMGLEKGEALALLEKFWD